MRKRLIILTFCAISTICQIIAQKVVIVEGEDQYYAPSTMSLDQAKQQAILQARIKILAAKFGTVINSTTNISLGNNESEQAHSLTDIQTLSIHEVKGEWIQDIREPEQQISYDLSMPNTTIIHTRIWGKAREIIAAKADIEVHLLKDTILGSDADVFRNEQSFYISFESPVTGYVTIYLLDANEDNAFCLLPTSKDNRGSIPVKNNKRYVFFSEDYARRHYTREDQSLGEEYIFTTTRSALFNQIFVIFSPLEFFKAKDQQEKDELYLLPRETTIPMFRKWLIDCKIRDPHMVERIIDVKIVK